MPEELFGRLASHAPYTEWPPLFWQIRVGRIKWCGGGGLIVQMMVCFQIKIRIYSIFDTGNRNRDGMSRSSGYQTLAPDEFNRLSQVLNSLPCHNAVGYVALNKSPGCAIVDSKFYICQIIFPGICLSQPLYLAAASPEFIKYPYGILITPEHCGIYTTGLAKP